MKEPRRHWWGGLAGIVTVLSLAAASVLVRHSPSTDQPTGDVTGYFTDHRTSALLAAYVEGTGTFGAGLARFVRAYGLQVVEVDRPDRSMRRRGKSDSEDVTGEDVRRGHRDGLTRSPTDQWVSCLGSVGHAGWPRRARTEQAP